jgi:tRNA G18 (ribose-2'-O)-methylase SpoU
MMPGRKNPADVVMRIELTDAADPRVADYRGITDAEPVRARGLFVAEGRLIVRRVVEDRRFRVRSLLVNEAAARDLDPVLAAFAPSVPVFVGAGAILQAIAGYDVHRGCLALVERPPASEVAEVIATARTLVILEGVANPDNVGGVFRNASAFGAGGCCSARRAAIRCIGRRFGRRWARSCACRTRPLIRGRAC